MLYELLLFNKLTFKTYFFIDFRERSHTKLLQKNESSSYNLAFVITIILALIAILYYTFLKFFFIF
jgi:hypothetical protein